MQNTMLKIEYKSIIEKLNTNLNFCLYLIGSRATFNHNKDSDYDFVLVFNSELNCAELISERNKTKTTLESINEKYSIKVFDLNTFKNLYFQDFFRYFEYKQSKKIIYNSTNIDVFNIEFENSPKLTQQITNSIIIQFWWSIIVISEKPLLLEKIQEKLNYRINRNINIFNSISNRNLTYFELINLINEDEIYKQIKGINIDNYEIFLLEYFKYFEHEKINKSDYYSYILKNNFEKVIWSIKSLKL